jgi:hypothetical protein
MTMLKKLSTKMWVLGFVTMIAAISAKPASATNGKQCNTVGQMSACSSTCVASYSCSPTVGCYTAGTQLKPKWTGASAYSCSSNTYEGKNCCSKNVVCGTWNEYFKSGKMDPETAICALSPTRTYDADPISTCYSGTPQNGQSRCD